MCACVWQLRGRYCHGQGCTDGINDMQWNLFDQMEMRKVLLQAQALH